MATTIEVHKQNVKQLLESGKENQFIIPEYQRPYAWSDEQVVTLFEDLWDFVSNENQGTYFLGSIVSYINENNEQEIIDGQQRITSLFLLLRAIYTKLKSEQPTKEATNFINQIEPAIWKIDKLTGDVNYEEALITSKVITDEANQIFMNILKTGKTSIDASDNYSKNYIKFIELFEKASTDNPLKIYEFIYSILNEAILLPITADSQDTALTIFSTLNDRGLPLSDADIFKAKIYNNLDNENKPLFIEKWKELDEDAVYCNESIQQLFYYYMFYLRALEKDYKTTTPGIRKFFSKNRFEQLQNPDLLENLKTILNIWRVVNKREKIESENWSKNPKIIQILDSLNSYPNEFWKYPVVIFYLRHRTLEDFNSRFLLFLRKLFIELLIRYIDNPTINAVKLDIVKLNVEIISTATPHFDFKRTDRELIKSKLKNPPKGTVRMLLKLLAYEKQETLLPDKWEIEHILPQKWQSNYFLNVDEDNIREKIEHIGNKLPFEKKLNIVAGNGYFDKKKVLFAESEIEITKAFSQLTYTDWNFDKIIERDIEICNYVINTFEIWSNDYLNSFENNIINLDSPSMEEQKLIEKFKNNGWI